MSHVPRPERSRRKLNTAAPPLQDDNKENDGRRVSTAKSSTKLDLDAFGEQLEKKYNIEGSNTLDIVYARRDNDDAQATIAAQAAQLDALMRQLASMKPAPARDDAKQATIAAQAAQLDALTRQLASMQATPTGDDATNTPAEAPAGDDEDDVMGDGLDGLPAPACGDGTNTPAGAGDDEDDPMEDDPAKALARENAHLKRQLAEARASASANLPGGAGNAPVATIPRPRGTAGTHFSIRKAMGLDKTAKDGDLYLALIRNMHDLVHQAGINWEVPWAETPAEAKGKLFAVARERHPIFRRFHNDWATEELVKQYIGNRRSTAYRRGDLEVPEKYKYLKKNAAKRDPSAPRGRKPKVAKVKVAAAKKAHKEKAAKVARKQTSGAASRKASSSKSKTQGKKKAAPVVESEDEDEEMPEFEGSDDDE